MENSSNSYFDKYMEVLKLPNVQRDSNEARKAAISKFKAKYPNADMSRFEVDLDLSGRITDVVTYFKVDDETSYEVNSDGFRSNPAYVKFLSSAIETRDGWPLIWASGGDIPSFSHLREPKHEWGIHHYPTFQSAVNLGYPLHNFRVYVSDTNYFYSKFTPIALHDWKNKSGGTYVKAGWVNFSNSDHLHFIPYDSNGITSIGTQLLKVGYSPFCACL
jgi:hypothetical protein